MKYKVGDWVEIKGCKNKCFKIIGVLCINEHLKLLLVKKENGTTIDLEESHIKRKLKKHEVMAYNL